MSFLRSLYFLISVKNFSLILQKNVFTRKIIAFDFFFEILDNIKSNDIFTILKNH